jgi:hypothetical protein
MAHPISAISATACFNYTERQPIQIRMSLGRWRCIPRTARPCCAIVSGDLADSCWESRDCNKNGDDEYQTPIGSPAGGSLGLDQKLRKGYEASRGRAGAGTGTSIGARAIAGTMECAARVARRPSRRHKSLKRKLM